MAAGPGTTSARSSMRPYRSASARWQTIAMSASVLESAPMRPSTYRPTPPRSAGTAVASTRTRGPDVPPDSVGSFPRDLLNQFRAYARPLDVAVPLPQRFGSATPGARRSPARARRDQPGPQGRVLDHAADRLRQVRVVRDQRGAARDLHERRHRARNNWRPG